MFGTPVGSRMLISTNNNSLAKQIHVNQNENTASELTVKYCHTTLPFRRGGLVVPAKYRNKFYKLVNSWT
jgi:hypothetical protein